MGPLAREKTLGLFLKLKLQAKTVAAIFPGNKPATDENFKSLALADREITPLAINPSALDTLPKSQTLNGLKN